MTKREKAMKRVTLVCDDACCSYLYYFSVSNINGTFPGYQYLVSTIIVAIHVDVVEC